jgi:hypothetical protein
MIRNLIVFVFVYFSASTVYAQFNDSVHHYVNFTSSGIINKTNNSSSYVLNNALRYNISKKSIRLNSSSRWMYGEQQKQLTNNDFNSTLDFNLYKTFKHFYYWGLANYDKSYSLRINNRFQAGLGGAYNIIDTTTAFLNISDGILYENSNLKVNDSTNSYYSIFRNSFRLRYKFVISNIIVVEGTNFFQNSLSNSNDYIINANNSVSLRLRTWLSLTAAANYNRNQQTDRENILVTFGLTAEKYF